MRGPWPRLLRRLIMTLSPYLQEVAKRRTFAIISHPDAGKTTITEKVLLSDGDSDRRYSKRSWFQPAREIRLDGDGKAAWYLNHHLGNAVPVS